MDLALLYGFTLVGFPAALGHLISLVASAGGVYWWNERKRRVDRALPSVPAGAFWVVTLTALFLRGGILAWMREIRAGTSLPALAVAAASAYLLIFIGLALITETDSASAWVTDELQLRWMGALAIASVLLRAVYLGLPELLHEEAYYCNYSRHMACWYLDHPPLVAGTICLFSDLLGNTELGVRLGALLYWCVGAWFFVRLTRKLYDATTATGALLLYALLPGFFMFGFVMLPDAGMIACWAGALYFLHRALIEEVPAAWIGAGACFGIGMLSKYTIALLGFATILYALFEHRARRRLRHPFPYLGLLMSLLLFSPVILWNAQNHWASFAFQSTRRLSERFEFALPELLGAILLLLTPVGVAAFVATITHRDELQPDSAQPETESHERAYRLLMWSTLFPLAVFVLLSLFHKTKLDWTGPLWLGALPFMARLLAKPPPEGDPVACAAWPPNTPGRSPWSCCFCFMAPVSSI